uniref:Uncharacterized protein n=1 Tax=Romanomermis culicivorax TaxID=13658 RepID=A0A915KAY0_ROMCU
MSFKVMRLKDEHIQRLEKINHGQIVQGSAVIEFASHLPILTKLKMKNEALKRKPMPLMEIKMLTTIISDMREFIRWKIVVFLGLAVVVGRLFVLRRFFPAGAWTGNI